MPLSIPAEPPSQWLFAAGPTLVCFQGLESKTCLVPPPHAFCPVQPFWERVSLPPPRPVPKAAPPHVLQKSNAADHLTRLASPGGGQVRMTRASRETGAWEGGGSSSVIPVQATGLVTFQFIWVFFVFPCAFASPIKKRSTKISRSRQERGKKKKSNILDRIFRESKPCKPP